MKLFEALEKTEPGAGGEIQLMDTLKKLRKRQPLYVYKFTGKRYDVGDKLGLPNCHIGICPGEGRIGGKAAVLYRSKTLYIS